MNPVWNEEFRFNISHRNLALDVIVTDQDTIKGKISVPIEQFND
jgi:hypothetical protein